MKVGSQLTAGVSTPLKRMGQQIIETGMGFEVEMKKMQGISRASGDDYKMLEKKARELGASTSKSATDAAQSFQYMALAGWDVNQMMQGAEPILNLSIATQMDLKTASDLVTDSLSSMKMEVSELPKYLDVVARAQSVTNTEAQGLMEAFLKVGNTATNIGMPLEETAASLGVFANNGLKGSLAGTKLNRILVRMTAQTEPAEKAWKKMGVNVYDANGKFRGLTTVLSEARVSLGKMTQEQQQMVLKMAVGADNVVAFKQLIDATDGTLQGITGELENSEGALDQLRSTMEDTTKNKIDQMKSALEEGMLKIFEVMAPIITDVAKKITDLANAFSQLDPDTQKMIIFSAAAAAAAGPVLSLAGGVVKLGAGIGKGLGGLNKFANGLLGLGKNSKGAKAAVEGVAKAAANGAKATASGTAATMASSVATQKATAKSIRHAKSMQTAAKSATKMAAAGNLSREAAVKMAMQAGNATVAANSMAAGLNSSAKAGAAAAKSVGEVATKTATSAGFFSKFGGLVSKGAGALGGLAMSALTAMGPVGILATTVGVVGGSMAYLSNKAEKARKELEVQPVAVLETKNMMDALEVSLGKVGAGYVDMANKGTQKTIELAESGKVVTQKNVDDILSIYKKGNENISKEMDRQYQEDLKNLLAQGSARLGLTQQEFSQVVTELKKKHEEEKKLLAGFEEEKKKILQTASNEKRALRNDEAMQMFELQMKENELVIGSMTVGETQKQQLVQQSNMVILSQAEDKKNELIKKAQTERDSTIEAARQQYLKQIEIAERIRSEGGEKAQQTADKIIKEAERQRDDTIKAAGETYENGIKVLNNKYEELANRSGLTREAVLGDLADISSSWDGWTPSPKTLGITYQVSTIETYKRQWAESDASNYGKPSHKKVNSVFNNGGRKPASIQDALNMYPGRAKGGTIFGNGWSLVGENGPELMHQSQGKTKVIPLNAQDRGMGGSPLGNQRAQINIDKMVVRNDQDIKRIAEELYRYEDQANLTQGKVKYF